MLEFAFFFSSLKKLSKNVAYCTAFLLNNLIKKKKSVIVQARQECVSWKRIWFVCRESVIHKKLFEMSTDT